MRRTHLQIAGLTTPLKLRPLLGIILYGILQGLSSLRDLERLARSDVACWWLSGSIMPDHSVIILCFSRREKGVIDFYRALFKAGVVCKQTL
ncbi:transposase [Methylomonas sp. SURF-2]|uniref:Transposase n=1 Tax=Methylomonas subterranea TaxID=2952225 RepID=A0ABT1TE81_9GAMM|nr:transposase [Methylomonas sp. SURF-2]MCQ8103767.1 transposase [Methylomonas sp. SURF-2]